MPKPKNLIGAWQEMRNTWKLQQTDPNYEFDTPAPPKREKQSKRLDDPLESSIGELAPKSIT